MNLNPNKITLSSQFSKGLHVARSCRNSTHSGVSIQVHVCKRDREVMSHWA
ncbi:hypothetical protein CRG98_006762 [Punica granatum]|uniref:Uncharacterized protein n=1 Tax=Punica granatum TaxID=22663 RepID=A0A2I0KWJ4_PUNGR|nr:hypothetical protein CRG98_006762 [Punica granatum]